MELLSQKICWFSNVFQKFNTDDKGFFCTLCGEETQLFMGSVVLLALSGLRGFGLGLIVSSQG